MSVRAIRLLHVEDDAIQRKLLHGHMVKHSDLRYEIAAAESEDEALSKLPQGFDLVLLDYHLAQGNGLACLKRIRAKDNRLPIIAISGVATPEIAAELLEAGADDYFSKSEFDADTFARSVRAALARADAWKARAPDQDTAAMSEIVSSFETLCADYARFADPSFLFRFDKLEESARAAKISFAQLMRIFESVCDRLAADKDAAQFKRLLRPIMLEIVLRLFEEIPRAK